MDQKILLYILGGACALLFIIALVQLALLLDLSGRYDNFSKETSADIKSLKESTSSLGTLMNAHLEDYNDLKKKTEEQGAALEGHNERIEGLSTNVTKLENDFSSFKNNYTELKSKYTNLLNYSAAMKSELDNFENTLMAKWQWVKDNAVLGADEVHKVEDPLDEYCGPDIKLACIPVVLSMKERYGYAEDYGDEIKPIKQFIADKGGDCEDWALFMKAYINSEPGNKMIRAYENGGGADYTIFEDGSTIYYYSDAREVKIGRRGDLEVFVICYDAGYVGHCIIAFANRTSSHDTSILERIDNAIAVEPQNGKVFGRVHNSHDATGKLYLNLTSGEGRPIQIIVSDDDLFLYNNDKWNSYSTQYARFKAITNP